MSDRKMTAKGFLAKTNTKAANSAGAFLAQYREWLTTGELADMASPILRKMDDKELMPTPALKLIAHAVMAHIIAVDQNKAEVAIEKAAEPSKPKPWMAQIQNAEGEVCTKLNTDGEEEELVKGFEHPQEADRWVDRRLFEGKPGWYGVVS